jgi:Fe-S cluster assembly protein SufD
MISLTYKDQNIVVTEPFLYQNNQLILPDKKQFIEPIRIEVLDSNIEKLDIIVGKSTEVKLIIEIASQTLDASVYTINLIALDNSHVKYLLVGQPKSKDAIINNQVSLHKDAQLNLTGSFLGDILKANLTIDLLKEGASVNMKSVVVSSQKNNQVLNAHITHYAPNTFGDMVNIGIVNQEGVIVLNGVEKIEKGMKNANAYQTLKGIILSDKAICEVNPILLIDEYDVKAGHGATVGKIEENQLYYLMSRGLSQKDAERLIINGFLKPVMDEMDDESLKERFMEITSQRI